MPFELPPTSHVHPSARPPGTRRAFLRRSAAGMAGAAGLVAARGALALPDGWQAVPGTDPTGAAGSVTARTVPMPSAPIGPSHPADDAKGLRRLSLVNDHTGERFDSVYCVRGTYEPDRLQELRHVMRDHRAGLEHDIDPALIDLLARLHARLDTDEPFHLLSGYRSPATNARLRKRSSGVAKFSLHMEGRAADIHVPGVSTRTLREEAMALAAGGVGYYSRSGFVHVDTGQPRTWGS